MVGLSELRKEYSKASLDVSSADPSPYQQFETWMKEAIAAGVPEPTAFSLATVSESGRPSSRIVLLKGMEEESFIFFTNYQSLKGKELNSSPFCSMNFFWPELERQVRIEGAASRLDVKSSDDYFKSRPRASQVAAWASPQSSAISSRKILEERVGEIEKRFEGQETLKRPHQWGGFKVSPILIEFWQGRPNRLHDRIQYSLLDGKWKVHRLAP